MQAEPGYSYLSLLRIVMRIIIICAWVDKPLIKSVSYIMFWQIFKTDRLDEQGIA
jgi:hypothetical protein